MSYPGFIRMRAFSMLMALGGTLCATVSAAVEPSPILPGAGETLIPFSTGGGIREWLPNGSEGMWIQAASGEWYYASFSSQCTDLAPGSSIRFVPESSGALSKWSSIRFDATHSCYFRSLRRSAVPPLDDELSEVSVVASSSVPAPDSPPSVPCGITGILWSVKHPANAWRLVAPMSVSSENHTCKTMGWTGVATEQP